MEHGMSVEIYQSDRDPICQQHCPALKTDQSGSIAETTLWGWGIVPTRG